MQWRKKPQKLSTVKQSNPGKVNRPHPPQSNKLNLVSCISWNCSPPMQLHLAGNSARSSLLHICFATWHKVKQARRAPTRTMPIIKLSSAFPLGIFCMLGGGGQGAGAGVEGFNLCRLRKNDHYRKMKIVYFYDKTMKRMLFMHISISDIFVTVLNNSKRSCRIHFCAYRLKITRHPNKSDNSITHWEKKMLMFKVI